MGHSVGHRSAAVFQYSSLPEQARAKSKKQLHINDLTPSQQALAQNRDVVAVIDGNSTTIIAPTGDFAPALTGVLREREYLGI